VCDNPTRILSGRVHGDKSFSRGLPGQCDSALRSVGERAVSPDTSEPVFNGDQSKPEPEQTPMKPKNPTPEELYRAWEEGGEDRLGKLLEQMTDEDGE
jgi:hypothetical protein